MTWAVALLRRLGWCVEEFAADIERCRFVQRSTRSTPLAHRVSLGSMSHGQAATAAKDKGWRPSRSTTASRKRR